MFGALGEDEDFVTDVGRALEGIERDGTAATVARALAADKLQIA